MKLTDICVSQTLAKKLEKAGYPQNDSLFYWCHLPGYKNSIIVTEGLPKQSDKQKYLFSMEHLRIGFNWNLDREKYAAPILSELRYQLACDFPYKAIFQTKFYDERVYFDIKFSRTYNRKLTKPRRKLYKKINDYHLSKESVSNLPKNEVEAVGDIWLYLKKNGLL